jgi:hypothetical protein
MAACSWRSTATLVGVFSIPPTFDAAIDGAGDLPGTAQSCAAANPCP